jgi:hypothetical protein
LQKSLEDVRAEQLTQQTEWAAKLQQAQEDLRAAREEALASKDAFETAARQAASDAAEAAAERERLAARMAAQQEVRMRRGARKLSVEVLRLSPPPLPLSAVCLSLFLPSSLAYESVWKFHRSGPAHTLYRHLGLSEGAWAGDHVHTHREGGAGAH